MVRKFLGFAATLLALPALLVAQAPRASAVRGKATRVQGDVVRSTHAARLAADATPAATGENEAEGKNNQEGVDEPDGKNNQEGVDEADGPNHQDGVDEPDGKNNHEKGEEVGQNGEDDNDKAAAAPSAAKVSKIGRHKP